MWRPSYSEQGVRLFDHLANTPVVLGDPTVVTGVDVTHLRYPVHTSWTTGPRVLIMRKLIATVFNYSLDGLLADEGTDFWEFCFSLPENSEPNDPAQLDLVQNAYAHIMGRTAYEAISDAMTTTAPDHPFAGILNAGRKVVFSRTLKTAEWANTTIAAGDMTEEVDKLRHGGDGYIVVWGGVSLWRSLMQLDLIDELQVSLFPYVAGKGTRLFDGVPESYRLDLVSSTASKSGIVDLRYRRHR
jgi:dihydrofolate reductase